MVDTNDYSGAKMINDAKSAKKLVSEVKKKAKSLSKNRKFKEIIDLYNHAITFAKKWHLNGEVEELEDLIRLTQIEGLKELKKIFEDEAYIAEDQIDYDRAIENYNNAKKVATEIFKLGVNGMEKEIKKLKSKAKALQDQLDKFYK